MQAQPHNQKVLLPRLWSKPKSKATCPRCQAPYEGIGCVECGWVADTSVAYFEVEALQSSKAIA
jgi:hypothetical protein